jgi:hypothetical protein
MASKRLSRPRDPIQLGKMIVDIATGQIEDRAPNVAPISRYSNIRAEAGMKGGPARARALSGERRKEIARHAAETRWGKK